MSKVYVISDTHFGHANILKFTDENGKLFRGDLFANPDEMDQAMEENYNSIVEDQDIVYHLGDVYFGPAAKADAILSRLKGRKRLILGNHDDGKDPILQKHFQKIYAWRKWPEYNCILTHMPLHPSGMYGKTLLNVHGHIHEKVIADARYINASVEQTNFSPILLETLIARAPVPEPVELENIRKLME